MPFAAKSVPGGHTRAGEAAMREYNENIVMWRGLSERGDARAKRIVLASQVVMGLQLSALHKSLHTRSKVRSSIAPPYWSSL